MSLLEKASLIITPNAVKAGKLFSVVPNTPLGDMDVVRATTATRVNSLGLIENVGLNVPRLDYTDGSCPSLLVEPQRTNRLLNSETVATQTISTTSLQCAVSFYGTGTITFSGTFVGSLVGTGVNNRVTLFFTPTSGSLILTVSGSVTKGQLETGSNATSYIPTVATAVTRNADVINQKIVPSTVGGTIINSNFYQKYTGQTPSIIDLRSDFNLFALIPSLEDVADKIQAVFLTDIKADIPFSIAIRGVGAIHWGDGSTTAYNSPSADVTINKIFLKNSGIVAFVGTLTRLTSSTANVNTSHRMEDLPIGMTVYSNVGLNTTSGSISSLPSGLTAYFNSGQNTTSGSIASLPIGLTFYSNAGQNTTSGSISSLPIGLTFYSNVGLNQVNQYTAGRVWANNMDLIDHKPAVGFGLTSTMVDNLLIDLANVTTWTGSRRITLTGNNAPRTAASAAAVATLQGNGVTVQTN